MMMRVALVLATLCVSSSRALLINVEASSEHCFYEDLKVRDALTVEFQVKKGGFLDVDLRVEDPSGGVLHEQARQSDGRVTLAAQSAGLFKICFGNKFSSLTTKTLDFDIHTSSRPQQPMTELEAARAEDVTGIENSIFQLGEGLEGVESAVRYTRGRMTIHHNTNRSTHQRVAYWNSVEAVVVVLSAIFQVWWLRRFFETRRAI
eukprot:TRINITY_DN383_c0_g1_i2.p2 TRINITY_DN383_c0_g1~~TRINITY_DN383_c0_g1_i2.p2  ORF type:complete len:205 (+),score=61.46 TRINITY_DN383_c0_g1_i2:128-742(+)